MIRKLSISVLCLLVGAVTMLGAVEVGSSVAFADGSAAALIEPAAGSGSAVVSVATPTLPDPIEAPGETLSMLTKLYKSGAWIGLSILLAFFILSYASKHVAWLKSGRRAVYCSAALGGLALLTVPASQGTTPNLSMVVAAVIAAMTLALNLTKPSEPTKA